MTTEPLRESRLSTLASAGVLALIATRMLANFEPFPYFSGDPLVAPAIINGFTPAVSAWMDVSTIALACIALLGEWRAKRPVSILLTLLTLIGATAAMHFVARGGGDRVGHIRLGLNWTAAWFGALALAHTARSARVRTLAAIVLLGVAIPLAGKGAYQFFVEHTDTVAAYVQNRDSFLAQQGWSHGSPNHLAYERRIMQNEATGWFSLSNPYASVVGACLVGMIALTIAGIARSRSPEQSFTSGWVGILAISAICAVGALVLSASKGGIAAAVLGLAVGGATITVSHRAPKLAGITRRLAPYLAMACVALVIIAVAARGLLGEQLGELSILFRWFYMIGSARMFAEHPLLGVGPSGFQQAYMMLKPALSPEDAASAHSLLFDLGSRLGIMGLAWAAVALIYSRGIGRTLVGDEQHEQPPAHATSQGQTADRSDLAILLATLAFPACFSVFFDAGALAPDGATVRALSLVLWIAFGAAALKLARESDLAICGALALAALVAFIHAQIEVTPVLEGTSGWFTALLGVVARPNRLFLANSRIFSRFSFSPLPAVTTAVAALAAVIFGALPVAAWEAHITMAGKKLDAVSRATSRLDEIARSTNPDQREFERAVRDIESLVGGRLPGETLDSMIARLVAKQSRAATMSLDAATRSIGEHPTTLQRASRTAAAASLAFAQLGDEPDARAAADEASAFATRASTIPESPASSFVWRVTLRRSLALALPEFADPAADLEDLTQAAVCDPYNPRIKFDIFVTLQESNADASVVRDAAKHALEAHEFARLDPLRQLPADDLKRVRAALSSPDP